MKKLTTVSLMYFAIALLGFGVTWAYFLQFFAAGGSLMPSSFMAAALANPVASAITVDVYLSAVAFSIWVYRDVKAKGGSSAWLWIVLCFAVGLCVAWPLYLGIRAQRAALD